MADDQKKAGKVFDLTPADRKALRASAKNEAWALQESSEASLADSIKGRAAKDELWLSDFMAITGALPDDEREIYMLDSSGVYLHPDYKIAQSAFRGHPLELQVEVARQDEAGLSFPCTPKQLLEFVDHGQTGHEFSVSDEFREAVGAVFSQRIPEPRRPKIQRADPLRTTILAAWERVGYDAPPSEVMAELIKLAADKDSCIKAKAPDGVVWESATGALNKLTTKRLSERMVRLRKSLKGD